MRGVVIFYVTDEYELDIWVVCILFESVPVQTTLVVMLSGFLDDVLDVLDLSHGSYLKAKACPRTRSTYFSMFGNSTILPLYGVGPTGGASSRYHKSAASGALC